MHTLPTQTIINVEAKIIELLRLTNIDLIDKLIAYMKNFGFFTCPASTKYHGAYKGGLAYHSLEIFYLLLLHSKDLGFSLNDIIIGSLLHDICKMGAYYGNSAPYKYNPDHPEGHGFRSVKIIKKFIKLTYTQETMIKYHMGAYGTKEGVTRIKEYSLKELLTVFKETPEAKALHLCDEIESQRSK